MSRILHCKNKNKTNEKGHFVGVFVLENKKKEQASKKKNKIPNI